MEKNMENFIEFMKDAILEKKQYISVFIKMEGYGKEEMIINPNANFVKKMLYYENAYNPDLTLKSYPGVKIIDYRSFNSIADFE